MRVGAMSCSIEGVASLVKKRSPNCETAESGIATR